MRRLLVIFAWFVVSVPLGWGIYQSVQKSLPLFSGNFGSQVEKPKS